MSHLTMTNTLMKLKIFMLLFSSTRTSSYNFAVFLQSFEKYIWKSGKLSKTGKDPKTLTALFA